MLHPSISIIIPTYQEVDNLQLLLEKLTALQIHFQGFEVIIVDDNSKDGTDILIKKLQHHFSWLKLITRLGHRDLSLSVLKGLNCANHKILLVMDADLSHSPEYIIPMMIALKNGAEFVIGSRFIAGGSIAESWPWFRHCNAKLARFLVKKLIKNINDPLSGFFCLYSDTFSKATALNPIGYKIGLELMLKCKCKKIVEIPIHFYKRYKNQSKLNWTQQFKFLRHLIRLYTYALSSVSG